MCVKQKKKHKKYELSYLEDENIRDKLYNLHYNSSGGDMLTYHPNREEIIEKINKTQKEQISKMTKEERQAKWGQNGEKNGMYGRTHTDEVKQLFSNLHKGNTYNLGRKVSQETKDKLSTIASQRLGEKNHFFGKLLILHCMHFSFVFPFDLHRQKISSYLYLRNS